MKKLIALAAVGISMLGASPLYAQGIGHTLFMRGTIVGTDDTGPIVCVGKADGATAGQVLEVYRIRSTPGPSKGVTPNFRRERVGQVRINHVFDDHFAHASVAEGKPAVHDIVELRKN